MRSLVLALCLVSVIACKKASNDAKPAPAPAGPVVVLASQVKRLSGDTPNIDRSKYTELPSLISVKVCIDTSGNVSSVDVITKVDRRTSNELVEALKGWKYTPYKNAGTAVPACFSVPFRVQ